MKKTKVIIMGAAGRDFHNFNVSFRDNPLFDVVAFTAEQIPNISGRLYPKELSGKLYPRGIPIFPERDLPKLIKRHKTDMVVLAYSDLPYIHVMHKASLVNSCGARFSLLGLETMINPNKPLIAITAVRTGCGKSQATHKVCEILTKMGKKPVVIRHPMPYGDLRKQVVQRFASVDDLKKHKCTIEEMEEYFPHIERGTVVYAGVDYEKILEQAEKEADVIVFDGGNNDFPFYMPGLWIVLLDPLRPNHEITYYPGEINLRNAHIAIINKQKSAKKEDIETVRANIKKYNKKAEIIDAYSEITTRNPALINNKNVLVIEDGPTLTHGGMAFGAGFIAAKQNNARIVDPKKYAVGSIKRIYRKYKHLKSILPTMGYSKEQIKELEKTINRTPCDAVICATPIDLTRIIKIKKPVVKITYELKELGEPRLEKTIRNFLRK